MQTSPRLIECRTLSYKLLLIGQLMLLCLTSCSGESFRACPAIVDYPDSEEAQVDHDLALLPPGSPVKDFIKDYGDLRNQVRACRS